MDIRVEVPNAFDFWFDDKSGDFVSYAKGVVGPLERGRIELPLFSRTYKDYLTVWVTFAVTAHQCVPAPMGIVPATRHASP